MPGRGKTEVYDKYPFVCLVGGYIRAIIIIITLRNKNTVLRKENQKNADILELLTADSLEDRLSDDNLTKFDTLIENIIKKDRETYIKQGNYPPGAGKGEGTGGSGEKPLTLQEAMKIANENPDVNIDSLMSRVQTSANKE